MKHLKLHSVNKYFYPVKAGIETNILNTYGFLVKNGWDITCHVSKNTLTQKNVLPGYEKINGLKVKRYQFGKFGFNPKIEWDKIDVLVLHNFDMFPQLFILLNCLVRKLLGKKKFALILSTHGGLTPDWDTFSKITKLIKKTYHETLGVFLINHVVDGVRSVSDWERHEIEKIGVKPEIVTVINNGVEEVAFTDLDKLASKKTKSIVSKNSPYIIQVGRIHPIKNYETAIKAMTKLPKNVNYLIVGPDQDLLYRKKLLQLIKRLKLNNRVKFIDTVSGADKFYLMKNAQLMVHMATAESFCNVVHEGMSQGLVCVVSDRTNLPYLVKDGINGFVLDAFDDKTLAEKINFILKNKNSPEIRAIQKRNILFTKNHTWENVSKQVESLYKSIL